MNRKIERLARVAKHFLELTIANIMAFFLKLVYPSYRGIWIVSERGDDARDNGYFFYRYLKHEHPEINAWYVISKRSADCPKIDKLGNRIEYNSFQHYLLYALCEIRISSSLWGGDLPNADYFHKMGKFFIERKIVVFLQHGITKDYMPLLFRENVRLDLFVCGAKPEYEYVRDNFGHADRVVQYTGFARFDNLHNIKTKRQILLMPTFRRWLQGKEDVEVMESDYIKNWNTVLSDKKLANALEDNNLELIFYPHYVMQRYVELFHSSSEKIKIAKFEDYDVQQLLIESKLLVTDFSSVFFDFGYMGKPVIYFQFDRNRYILEHYDYTKGYFDYDSMGFGPVVSDAGQLVSEVIRSIDQRFSVMDEYQNRVAAFFTLKDRHNADRIFARIKKTIGEERR